VRRSSVNIAGVVIPVFEEVLFEEEPLDLFATPPWLDDGMAALKDLARLRAEQMILEEQFRLLSAELLVTSQRVNLFEKVKIPEASNNIRVIRIFLGDMDAAGVVRSKIAKRKSLALMKSA
jgi:V/A-type H+-transporting ATPase subunit D